MKILERMSLRARLFLLVSALVLGALTVSAIGFYVIEERLEEMEVQAFLEQEADHLRMRVGRKDEAPLAAPNVVFLAEDAAPAKLRLLAVGGHTGVMLDGRRHDVLVQDWGGDRFYLALPENDIERMEGRVLVLFSIWVMLLTILAMWLGYRLSARLIGPVTALASRVQSLQPADRGVRLAQDFRGEEVERIARAFDLYLTRLDGFVERERSFTSTASHELRTPLAVISGAAEILATTAGDAAREKAVERIQRAASEMHQFIDALLSLARAEDAGQFRAETDVAQTLRHTCEEIRELVPPAVELECRCEGPMLVGAPATLVHIVVSNLLRNALRHTSAGQVRVACGQRCLEVSDDGEGMPSDVLERAVERHFSGAGGGAGVGLYLVKRICDQYDWVLAMDSHPGKGTRVRIDFGAL